MNVKVKVNVGADEGCCSPSRFEALENSGRPHSRTREWAPGTPALALVRPYRADEFRDTNEAGSESPPYRRKKQRMVNIRSGEQRSCSPLPRLPYKGNPT